MESKKRRNILHLKKMILCFTALFIICITTVQAYSDSTEGKEELTFFLEDNSTDIINQIKNQFGEENFEYISEIGLAKLTIDSERKDEFDLYDIEYTELPKINSESLNVSTNSTYNLLNNSTYNLLNNSTYDLLNNSTYLNFTWNYKRILEPLDDKNSNGGKGVAIALIDSGVDVTHPGLQDNQIVQINYSNSESSEDEYGHGTQIAGVIDTLSPNATLYSYKVMGGTEGDSYDIFRAIIDAAIRNVDIINISLSTQKNTTSDLLTIEAYKRAVDFAKNRGIFVVASAGNTSTNLDEQESTIHLPGGLDDVITVGATTKDGAKADYSNYGTKVQIYGPAGWLGESYSTQGVVDAREMMMTYFPTTLTSIFETPDVIPKGTTLSYGTSLAAPEVSSALATIISKYYSQKGWYDYYQVENELFGNSKQYNLGDSNVINEVRIKD